MSERIYASDGRFIGVTGDEKDARIAELEDELSDITIERLREKQTELAENGGCPCCLAGDEEGHVLGCELSELEADRALKAEAIHDLVDRAEQAEAALAKMKERYTHSWTQAVEGVETPFDVELVPKPELDATQDALAEREQALQDIADGAWNVRHGGGHLTAVEFARAMTHAFCARAEEGSGT